MSVPSSLLSNEICGNHWTYRRILQAVYTISTVLGFFSLFPGRFERWRKERISVGFSSSRTKRETYLIANLITNPGWIPVALWKKKKKKIRLVSSIEFGELKVLSYINAMKTELVSVIWGCSKLVLHLDLWPASVFIFNEINLFAVIFCMFVISR